MFCGIKCAYCGCFIGYKSGNFMTKGIKKNVYPPVSHGICQECKERVLKEIREQSEDKNEIPIL